MAAAAMNRPSLYGCENAAEPGHAATRSADARPTPGPPNVAPSAYTAQIASSPNTAAARSAASR